MFFELKNLDCEGYLLLSTNVPYVKPSRLPLRVRWQVKRDIKKTGFVPFLTGWAIKPIYNKASDFRIREALKFKKYELPVKMTFIYLSKNDFLDFEIYEPKGYEACD